LLETRPCGIPCAFAELKISWPPAFALHPHDITSGFEQVGIDGKFLRQIAVQIATRLEPVRRLSREHGRARRRAGGRRAKSARKEHAFARDPIKVGCLHDLVAVNSCMRPGPVISEAEENVRARGCEL